MEGDIILISNESAVTRSEPDADILVWISPIITLRQFGKAIKVISIMTIVI